MGLSPKDVLDRARAQARIIAEATPWVISKDGTPILYETSEVLESGAEIVGTVVAKGFIETEYGVSYTTTLELEDGSYKRVAWMGSVLANEYEKNEPQINDTVALIYQGRVDSRTPGRESYHSYAVVVLDSNGNARNPISLSEKEDESTVVHRPLTKVEKKYEPFPDE